MINIKYFHNDRFVISSVKEIEDSHPRSFIVTLEQEQKEQIEKTTKPTLLGNKKSCTLHDDIKIFLIQNQELNQFSLYSIFKFENSHLDLISYITNIIMSRSDGITFTITQSGIDGFQKLQRQILIKDKPFFLSQLITENLVNRFVTMKEQIYQIILIMQQELNYDNLLLLQQDIDISSSLDKSAYVILNKLRNFQKVIDITCKKFQSLESINQQDEPLKFQQELNEFLQELNNI